MKKNNLKEKLYDGRVCLGTWVFIPSPDIVEIIGLSKFDFIVIDMEHSPISFESAIHMMRSAESNDLSSVIRVPSLNSSSILRALDSGAAGIQVPHISTVEDAHSMVEFSKYHPIGSRGMAPNSRAGKYTYKDSDKRSNVENKKVITVINVEGLEGIKNLDKICKVDGVDVIFLGPYDLSQSLGFPGQIDRSKVLNLIEKSVKKIRNSGKIAGCFSKDYKYSKTLIDLGVQYITYSADGPIIRGAFETIRGKI